ncbi:MAG: YqiA/YcfP family alpha/beta fold hydrolase [Oceanospirillaceae bacterium]
MSLAVIYIHGFNSSPLSTKAKQLQAYFTENQLYSKNYQLHIPALDFQPAVAIGQLSALVEKCLNQQVLLIGSSLGGYYSLWLAQQYRQCSAVLINPAVYPYLLLAQLLGENQNIYTGDKYRLTTEHIQQLKAIEVTQLTDLHRYLLLSQTADETLDYREAVQKLQGIEQRVSKGGNHSFENFQATIPQIFEFVADSV